MNKKRTFVILWVFGQTWIFGIVCSSRIKSLQIFCIELKISLVFVAWYTIHQTSNFQTLGSLLLDTYYKACHSVSKLHFLSKNYKSLKNLKNGQFLFLSQNWLFLAVKIRNIWFFVPKLVKNCHFVVYFCQF